MFYDLDDTIKFSEDVYDVMDKDGLWHLEQSYMPMMLKNNSYDTICHEHLEYYSLKSIKYIFDKVGFKCIVKIIIKLKRSYKGFDLFQVQFLKY